MTKEELNRYTAASCQFKLAFISVLTTAILLMISFACPYWLESYTETSQPFIRMGLWRFCFNNYRHPQLQLDRKFDGCHSIFSDEYLIIREWLQPGWLMFVQAMMCISLFFSLLCFCVLSVAEMRYCLKYKWFFVGVGFIFQILIAVPAFLAVTVFGVRCQDKSWFLNPNYNFLSWAYCLAVTAIVLCVFSAVPLFMETRDCLKSKRKANYLNPKTAAYRY